MNKKGIIDKKYLLEEQNIDLKIVYNSDIIVKDENENIKEKIPFKPELIVGYEIKEKSKDK